MFVTGVQTCALPIWIPYRYIDLEASPEAVRRLQWLTGGSASHPTVVIGDQVIVEPSLGELEAALSEVEV